MTDEDYPVKDDATRRRTAGPMKVPGSTSTGRGRYLVGLCMALVVLSLLVLGASVSAEGLPQVDITSEGAPRRAA